MVLGAAIIDDVIGLVVLGVVSELAGGRGVSAAGVATISATAVGFLAATLLVGRLVIPPLTRLAERIDLPGTPAVLGLTLAFALAWLADRVGSAMIIGAFAAGLLLARAPRFHDIEAGAGRLGHFFIPLFFVTVGAAVDVRVLNPLDPSNRRTLAIAALLTAVAVLTKFAAGYAPFWFRGRKAVIGAAMIPRGEVGLIFAQMGVAGGVFDARPLRRRDPGRHGDHLPRPPAAEGPLPAAESPGRIFILMPSTPLQRPRRRRPRIRRPPDPRGVRSPGCAGRAGEGHRRGCSGRSVGRRPRP